MNQQIKTHMGGPTSQYAHTQHTQHKQAGEREREREKKKTSQVGFFSSLHQKDPRRARNLGAQDKSTTVSCACLARCFECPSVCAACCAVVFGLVRISLSGYSPPRRQQGERREKPKNLEGTPPKGTEAKQHIFRKTGFVGIRRKRKEDVSSLSPFYDFSCNREWEKGIRSSIIIPFLYTTEAFHKIHFKRGRDIDWFGCQRCCRRGTIPIGHMTSPKKIEWTRFGVFDHPSSVVTCRTDQSCVRK